MESISKDDFALIHKEKTLLQALNSLHVQLQTVVKKLDNSKTAAEELSAQNECLRAEI